MKGGSCLTAHGGDTSTGSYKRETALSALAVLLEDLCSQAGGVAG